MSYIGDYFKNIGIGSDANRTKIEADGTLKYEGDAKVWEDVVGSLIGRRLASNVGTVDYDWAENAIKFQDGGDITDVNDCIIFNYQYPHAGVLDGVMNLHIHWEQISATTLTFDIKYRIQDNGVAKTETWTDVSIDTNDGNKFAYTSGTLNQITDLASVDMTGTGISATVQFRITRSDDIDIDCLATFIDAHVQLDTDGSRTEYVK